MSTTFKELFNRYSQWQRQITMAASRNIMEIEVKLKTGNRFKQQYGLWRSPDGRLLHSIAFKNDYYNPKKKNSLEYSVKMPDCTSGHLLSAEAIALKQTMIKCNNFLNTTHFGETVKMLTNTHDELVFLIKDTQEAREGLKQCLQFFAEDFNTAVDAQAMETENIDIEETLCNNYSEK